MDEKRPNLPPSDRIGSTEQCNIRDLQILEALKKDVVAAHESGDMDAWHSAWDDITNVSARYRLRNGIELEAAEEDVHEDSRMQRLGRWAVTQVKNNLFH